MMLEVHKHGDYSGLKMLIKQHLQMLLDHAAGRKAMGGIHLLGDGAPSLGYSGVAPKTQE